MPRIAKSIGFLAALVIAFAGGFVACMFYVVKPMLEQRTHQDSDLFYSNVFILKKLNDGESNDAAKFLRSHNAASLAAFDLWPEETHIQLKSERFRDAVSYACADLMSNIKESEWPGIEKSCTKYVDKK